MNATIKDIAKRARVSYATVSRALNNKYGVRPETRARIREIARKMSYSPNGIARGLVKRQTRTIGLIIPDITNPFFPEVARGIEDGAQERGYSVFLCNTNWEDARERQYLELLAEKRVDGLVVAPISNVVDAVRGRQYGSIPVVYVSNAPQGTARSFVVIDNVRGAYLATRHLIDSGYRRIGFIGAVEGSLSIDERMEGYKVALRERGLAVSERYIKLGHFRQETGAAVIRGMIEEGDYPEAVFAENDLLALGVIQGVQGMGLAVPRDVAVVGFDDIPFAGFQEVQLTTVCQPKYHMGKTAVGLLLDEIGSGRPRSGAARQVVLEPELIVRKTSLPG